MHLRLNALDFAVLTALIAILGAWSGDSQLETLWLLPLALLLLGLAYEAWVLSRAELSVRINAAEQGILGRTTTVQLQMSQQMGRRTAVQWAPTAPDAIEIDTSITGARLIRIFQRLQQERGLPSKLRVDNGPEFLSADFVTWAEAAGMTIQYIQKGEPNQNAYIERFNRTYREEVLSLYLFEDLHQVREVTYWWRIDYNESRPHDALGDRTPAECLETEPEHSIFELST